MAVVGGLRLVQLDFWTQFAQVLPDYGFSARKPAPKNWCYLPIGTSRAKLVLTIEVGDQLLGCKLSVEHSPGGGLPDQAHLICDGLTAVREEIEGDLGFADLDWGTPSGSRVYRYRHAALGDPAAWPTAFDWLGATARRFREVFGPRIAQMQLPSSGAGGTERGASATPRAHPQRYEVVDRAVGPEQIGAGRFGGRAASCLETALGDDVKVEELFRRLADEHDLDLWPAVRAGDATLGVYSREKEPVYRYAFAQWWGAPSLRTMVAWVLLNPAPGDTDRRRRPVLESCLTRSHRWKFTGLVIVNLFAYRTRDPDELEQDSAQGPHNDDAIRAVTGACGLTIAAWGDGQKRWRRDRAAAVLPLLSDPYCLEVAGHALTRFGQPLHPLYKPLGAERVPLPRTTCSN